MIPRKLFMEGFGSYLKETEIDFDKADEIFLISGATGAGKSLILDAVTYSLFGKGAGDRTEFVSKCLHGSERKMRVSFTFEASGEVYEFERTVRFPKSRKSNEDQDNGKSEAAAYKFVNGEKKQINSKNTDTEVNRLAQKILHMSPEQFRQIIVLPQGKIESLLTSGSKDKQALFTDLFGTDEIDRIAAALKKKVNEEKKILDDKSKSLETFYKPDFQSIGELAEEITKKKADHKILSDELSEIDLNIKNTAEKLSEEEKLSERFDEQNRLKLSLIALESKEEEFRAKKESLAKIDSEMKVAAEYKIYQKSLEDLKIREDEAKETRNNKYLTEQRKQSAEKKLEDHKKQADTAETAREKYKTLSEYIEKIKITAGLEEEYNTAKAAAELSNKKYQSDLKKYEEQKLQIKNDEEKADSFGIEELQVKLNECNKQMVSLKIGKEYAAQAGAKQAEADKLKKTLEELSRKYAAAEEKKNKTEAEYETAYEAHIDGLAAELSEKLSEGEKCPVCGSIHHPEPFHSVKSGLVSADELRKKKAAAEKSAEEWTKLQNSLNVTKSQFEEAERAAADMLEKSAEYGYSEEAFISLSRKTETINNKLAEYSELEKEIKEKKNKLEKLREISDSAKDKLADDESSCKLAEQKLADYKQTYENNICAGSDPEKELENCRKIYTGYDETLANLTNGLSEISNKLLSVKAQSDIAENEVEKCRENYRAAYEALDRKLAENGISRKAEEFVIDEKGIAAVDVLRKECSDHDHELEKTKKALAELNSELDGKIIPDIKKRREELDKLNKDREEKNTNRIKAEQYMSQLQIRYDGYKREESDFKSALEVFERKNKFADMICGDKEMSFSRYVLGIMLDSVLDKANIMLERILDSNYRLYRQINGKKSSKLGLDINVVNYSVDAAGADYPVKELSGGEKFVMSVILGLSIAEAAQDRTGGIQVNSMFIDEGFGTLDEETLLRIMEILRAFGKGKKIGIISHVESLGSTLSGFSVTRTAGEGSMICLEHK